MFEIHVCVHVYVCMFSRVQLFVNSMDCSPPDSSVSEIFQARVLEWVAISSPGDLTNPGIEPLSLESYVLAGKFFLPLGCFN